MKFTLKQYLERTCITRKEAASEFGVSLSTIDRWLSGRQKTPDNVLSHINRYNK